MTCSRFYAGTDMKKFTMYFVFALLGGTCMAGTVERGPAETVRQFYLASQNGNVSEMQQLIAGTFYNRREILLKENSEYPYFLRTHYLDTRITVEKTITDDNNAIAVVTASISYPDGNRESHELILKQDDNGIWKIVDEKTD